ncbi:MAG: ATP-binding protein [Gammaproteobacteria bacterium]
MDTSTAAHTGTRLPTGWLVAAVAATLAMLGWLAWHAAGSVWSLREMQTSHAQAAQLHDTLLRLGADLQRTAQMAVATDDTSHLTAHAATEVSLRAAIEGLLATRSRPEERGPLTDALASISALSEVEANAIALLEAGQQADALRAVTGPAYEEQLANLTGALQRFDDSYHRWGLAETIGLTRKEIASLSGAFGLFTVVIAAWILLILRLQRERVALVNEIGRRSRAEAQLLQAQKNEVLGQLAGGIAHDVDNVLSAAAGYSGLARRSSHGGSRSLALDGLDKAIAQGRGLTRNLLSFTRQETTSRRPVELSRLVDDTRSWLAPLLPGNIRLETRGPSGGELWVNADPVQLQQAFLNLALNARDAMPHGGTLRVSVCRRGSDALDPGTDGVEAACISLADSGSGMDADTLARAGEALFTTKPPGRGTGLGLSAVHRIVQSHGGRVEMQSAPGAGTRVRLLLPVCPRPRPDGDPDTGPRQALVASADEYVRELLAAALEDAGLAVEVRGDPRGLSMDVPPGATVAVLDWPEPAAAAESVVRRLKHARPDLELILFGDTAEDAAEPDFAELAMVVSRTAPLGQLGALARRLSRPSPPVAG